MFPTPARAAIAILTAATAGAIACSRPARVAADLLITHAKVWTGTSAQPGASGLAIIGDRIVDVGGADEIEHWRGAGTTVLDAGGRRVVPGFNDAHVRFMDGGVALDRVDLTDADSPAEFVRRIAERVKAKPGEWMLGGGWDTGRWAPASLPTRQMIDDVTNGTPVFVSRIDGRVALANSAALGRAGITERTPDPPGGALVRDPATGFPTGILEDAAMDAVLRVIPKTTPEQRLHAAQRALEHAASLGVTSVQDMNPAPEDVAVYADLAARDALTARIYAVSAEAGWYDQAKLGLRRAFGSPWLRLGAVTGSLDAASHVDEARIRLMAADHAGLQLCLDAGEGPTARTLDLFADIVHANGGRDRRFRIERAQVATPEDAERLARLNVIASLQPARAAGAFRTLADKGVRLALGSGWPAAPLSPMLALSAATTALTVDGRSPDGRTPRQPASIAAALSAYTSGSAFAEFQEDEKGTLARGALADLLILSDDIVDIPPARIRDVHVLTTIVGGRVVHQQKP